MMSEYLRSIRLDYNYRQKRKVLPPFVSAKQDVARYDHNKYNNIDGECNTIHEPAATPRNIASISWCFTIRHEVKHV